LVRIEPFAAQGGDRLSVLVAIEIGRQQRHAADVVGMHQVQLGLVTDRLGARKLQDLPIQLVIDLVIRE
jgi:hypothetical protein